MFAGLMGRNEAGTAMSETALKVLREEIGEEDFDGFAAFALERLGIRVPSARRKILSWQLSARLEALGLPDFAAYRSFLLTPEGQSREVLHLWDAVTTNTTAFYRESAHFDFLVREALPRLTRNLGVGCHRPLRGWSAGCSSGEEVYTLAMVLDHFGCGGEPLRYSLLATDVSPRVLAQAEEARYPEARAERLPAGLRQAYLLPKLGDRRGEPLVEVCPELRKRITFRRLNFMDEDYRLRTPFDILFFRNVLIYFDRPTQERVLKKLCRHLGQGRYLFVGLAETLHAFDLPLERLAPGVYRRTP